MKLKKIVAILLFSAVIIVNFPVNQFDVQNQIYKPLGHGAGAL
ncbi:hypothetical protein PAECIP112173_04006 [Paenibacillus sp. JJ-100]|nr:hypothetical protein PAECIP112173_04006 [Paenibacillus sp. JJ-100]